MSHHRLIIPVLIELCWNIYPATWWSSFLLFATHLFLLFGLYISNELDDDVDKKVRVKATGHNFTNLIVFGRLTRRSMTTQCLSFKRATVPRSSTSKID